jgi:DNA-binding transcriptional LysR family regulator
VDAPIDLNLVRAFARVYETGSFSAAAARLGVPRSTVSRAVSALEASTGLLLFHRTTRSVTSTAAAHALFERVSPALLAVEASLLDLPEVAPVPTGTLRVATSVDLGAALLSEAVARFLLRYPEVKVEVKLGAALVDLARGGFDLGLRFAPGALRGGSMVTRKLGPVSFRLYAAPAYLSRRGTPRSVEDLRQHDGVLLRGSERELPLIPRSVCDDKMFARAVLHAGAGIGILPAYLADESVETGALVRVLPRWESTGGVVYLVQPSRQHVPLRVTAFREILLRMLPPR